MYWIPFTSIIFILLAMIALYAAESLSEKAIIIIAALCIIAALIGTR